jgi:oligopeptide/dipeptide ABC transporter ATP-binding protein
MAILMITHDLGIIAEMAKRVVVMYAGQIVETSNVGEIFDRPRHPYTIGLQASIPRPEDKGRRLKVIPGKVPDPMAHPSGCRFSDRCPFAEDRCRRDTVGIREATVGHSVRCWKDLSDLQHERMQEGK